MLISYLVLIYLAAFIFKLTIEEPYSQLMRLLMNLGQGSGNKVVVSNNLEDVQKNINVWLLYFTIFFK